jgi:hypothetical protein
MNNWKDMSTTIPGIAMAIAMIATTFGLPDDVAKAIVAIGAALLGIFAKGGGK